MQQYHALLREILDNGTDKTDRTGTGTRSIFGHQMRFNLADGFPLVTTKKVHLKSIVHELLWLVAGDTNIKYLVDNGVNIWTEWPHRSYNLMLENNGAPESAHLTLSQFTEAVKNDADFANYWGDLGAVYGAQWRRWRNYEGGTIDQVAEVLRQLREQPDSRRIIINAWNVADLPQMALSPCHAFVQFNTAPLSTYERVQHVECTQPELYARCMDVVRGSLMEAFLDEHNVPSLRLDCQLYQRSADTFLGLPYNIASYSLLTMMMAQVTNMVPGEFVWSGGDNHLYSNHLEQARLQLTREPRPLPTMRLNPAVTDLFAFRYEDFTLENYDPWPAIKAPVAV